MVINNLHLTLRTLREEHGIKQEVLANHLHISRKTYSAYETGKRRPSTEILTALAQYYDISLDEMIRFSDSYEPKIPGQSFSLPSASPSSDTSAVIREPLTFYDREETSPVASGRAVPSRTYYLLTDNEETLLTQYRNIPKEGRHAISALVRILDSQKD